MLINDCYESLSRGRPVTEVLCNKCLLPISPDTVSRKRTDSRSVKCACGNVISYSGFNSPLGRYSPVVRTVDGATGIFLTLKGQPPL